MNSARSGNAPLDPASGTIATPIRMVRMKSATAMSAGIRAAANMVTTFASTIMEPKA